MMACSLGGGEQPRPGKPVELFEYPRPLAPYGYSFEVTGDGERFLISEVAEPETREIWYVQNWIEEFRAPKDAEP